MANYVPFARSNYFKVKDPAAFEAFCTKWGVELIRGGEGDELFGFFGHDDMGIPQGYFDPQQDDYVDGDFMADLATHLAEGWVAIVREIGYEKMRYLVGYTVAVNSKGERREIGLDGIYELAKDLGEHVTVCEY